jgi:hypothetical protein
MPFLTASPFDLADGHAGYAQLAQGRFHVFKFKRLDNRFYFLHGCTSMQ